MNPCVLVINPGSTSTKVAVFTLDSKTLRKKDDRRRQDGQFLRSTNDMRQVENGGMRTMRKRRSIETFILSR